MKANASFLVRIAFVPLLLALPAAHAQMPVGSHVFDIDGQLPLYEFSDTYSESIGGIDLDFTMNMDAQGRLTGAGVARINDQGVSGSLDIDLTGKVGGSASAPRLQFTLKMTGALTASGQTVAVSAVAQFRVEPDVQSQLMVGTLKITVSVKGQGRQTVSEAVSVPLPPDSDGSWTLEVDLRDLGRGQMSADAVVDVAGRECRMEGKGKYAEKTGSSKVALKGTTELQTAGSSLKFELVPGQAAQAAIRKLKGRILGQKVMQ